MALTYTRKRSATVSDINSLKYEDRTRKKQFLVPVNEADKEDDVVTVPLTISKKNEDCFDFKISSNEKKDKLQVTIQLMAGPIVSVVHDSKDINISHVKPISIGVLTEPSEIREYDLLLTTEEVKKLICWPTLGAYLMDKQRKFLDLSRDELSICSRTEDGKAQMEILDVNCLIDWLRYIDWCWSGSNNTHMLNIWKDFLSFMKDKEDGICLTITNQVSILLYLLSQSSYTFNGIVEVGHKHSGLLNCIATCLGLVRATSCMDVALLKWKFSS